MASVRFAKRETTIISMCFDGLFRSLLDLMIKEIPLHPQENDRLQFNFSFLLQSISFTIKAQ